jgi:hypothetical protein
MSNLSSTQTVFFSIGMLWEVKSMVQFLRQDRKKLFYFSNIVDQAGLLSEFVWEHLHEEVEPMIIWLETVKAAMRIWEYGVLLRHEKLNCYIDKGNYEQVQLEKEQARQQHKLPRSGKRVPKLKGFAHSKTLRAIATESRAKHQPELDASRVEVTSEPASNAGLMEKLLSKTCTLRQFIKHKRFNSFEVVNILRPLLYLLAYWKFGRKSFKPIVLSLALELFVVYKGMKRIAVAKECEQDEYKRRRNFFLLKYLLKEPVYSRFTVPLIRRVFGKFLSASKVEMISSILQYFSYYHYTL